MIDTDSDNDFITNNNFSRLQHMNTTAHAKGPNITSASISFRSQVPRSINIPRNMKHSGYARSLCDQRSVNSGRKVSPMSVQSGYAFQPRNFNRSYYPRGMSSQRSVINGRSGSPMSMSMASITSVSAVDIAIAIKNAEFNKHDFKIIADACKKFQKDKIRKKFEKRRNRRLFLKRARYKSGGESGEQASDSSISSDDCRSTKTSTFKENMSSCRSTKTDLTNIRRTIQESNIYNDCSVNLKQISFKNMFSIDSGSFNTNMSTNPQNAPLQKDRFKSGFLLPSQRFNKSVAASTIPENVEKQQKNINQMSTKENYSMDDQRPRNFMSTTDSEHDEIFEKAPIRQKTHNIEPQRKRSLEKDEDTHMPHKKRNKLSPIKKNVDTLLTENGKCEHLDTNKDDFIFAKPSVPIKKNANLNIKETLLAKSPHLNNIFERNYFQKQNNAATVQNTTIVQEKYLNQSKDLETTKLSNTDVSMRPSFIKRKLFTQKLDVAEHKAINSDIENSPKTVYGGIQKEKNKARKLVTNQSCLSREVLQDDNYLHLIHKIVPPDQINSTNQINKTTIERKSKDVDDKWDTTSVISTCNNENVSDTYTDEDIFQDYNNTKNNNNKDSEAINNNHIHIHEKPPHIKNLLQKNELKNNSKHKPSTGTSVNTNNMKTCVKSFWDTDIESDFEFYGAHKKMNTLNELQVTGNNMVIDHQPKQSESKKTAKITTDTSIINNTTATFSKFSNASYSIRSHRVTKKKKCCEELDQSNVNLIQTQNKNVKPREMSCSSYTVFANNVKLNNATNDILENKNQNGRPKRSCRTPQQHPKETTVENNKTKANRSLRSRKVDLSSTILDAKVTTKNKTNRQNANNSKQCNRDNNKQIEKIKPLVNSRNSDVSFSLSVDIKAVKTRKVIKKTDSANNSRERKPRQSNVSFSITSDPPVTRSRSANISNENQNGKKNNTITQNNDSKDLPADKQVLKTPNKRGVKNGVVNMVHDLKSKKSKSVRKR